MYKIYVPNCKQLEKAKKYCTHQTKGMYIICEVNGEIVGCSTFDIQGEKGIIEHIQGERDMFEPIILSTLNFLDLNGIYDVYAYIDCEQVLKKIGFRDKNISLKNFFTCNGCKKCVKED